MFGTFCISALWHGIYRGYWNFFIGGFSIDMTMRAIKQTRLAHQVYETLPTWIVIPVAWYCFHVALAYFGMGFVFLFEDIYRPYYENLNYCLHYVIPSVIAICMLILPKQPKESKVKDVSDKMKK